MTNDTALTRFLLELSARAETEGLDPRTLGLHVRRADLAEHLGLTLDGLERAFADLISHGLVGVEAEGTFTILDPDGLAQVTTPAASEPETGKATGTATAAGTGTPGRRELSRDRTEFALRAILSDERFLSAPRTSALLVYLVEQAIADGAEYLDATRIAVEVLGKPAGFDPTDPALRVLVTRLRKMLDEYDASRPDAPVRIGLERGALRVRIESRDADTDS